jgi:hypothetical protein
MSRGITRRVKVTYETEDGRELVCKYDYEVTLGFTSGLPENCYPDETEVGEPEYYLDGKWIEESDLPEDLKEVAEAMYSSDAGEDDRFSYQEKDYDDY